MPGYYVEGSEYLYRKPVDLPKGTVIKLEATYDNSADNPSNPSKPPRRVRWGEQTTDEMCLLGVQVVTDSIPDLLKVVAMRGNRLVGGLAGKADGPSDFPPIPIPDRFRAALGRYDQDGDGWLSRKEVDAMPDPLADRVRRAIRRRLEGGNDADQP